VLRVDVFLPPSRRRVQSNLAWSYARHSHFSPELFGAIAARVAAPGQAAQLTNLHIAHLLWAVATLNGEWPKWNVQES